MCERAEGKLLRQQESAAADDGFRVAQRQHEHVPERIEHGDRRSEQQEPIDGCPQVDVSRQRPRDNHPTKAPRRLVALPARWCQ